MRRPKLRELWEAVKVVCRLSPGAYTMQFPFDGAAPDPAPSPHFRGKPKYDEKGCVGCGACAQVCPSGAIAMTDDAAAGRRRLVLDYGRCIFCGTCERACITGEGVRLSQEYDTAVMDRRAAACSCTVEKALALCERCRAPITGTDHLVWMAERLGSMAYTNPTVALALQEKLGLSERAPALAAGRQASRGDLYRRLCPGCRRVVLLREHWI